MTSAWFDRFAANASDAAAFLQPSDPAMSRRFAEMAASARRLAAQLARQEQLVQIGDQLAEIRDELAARSTRG